MPSGRERYLGIGLCAVSRALKAAKLLMGLHDYDSEKLSNLPPEGVASVTGLTMAEFNDALAMWMSARKKDNSLTFPQVLWLIGSQPNADVKVNFVGFSQVPESFDRKVVVNQYVNTLALCFGVDAREFWPVSSGALGTAAETEVQHMKARGKGPGEYITTTERAINGELPDGVEFKYDTQDIEEDMEAAMVAKAWVEAYLPLTTAGGAAEEILSKDELMRLLADKGVVPDWMVRDDRIIADDMGMEEKYWTHDDVIIIEWNEGVLKQKPLPTYKLQSFGVEVYANDSDMAEYLDGIPYAESVEEKSLLRIQRGGNGWEQTDAATEFLKQENDEEEPVRNIRGKPIPEKESIKGASVTRSAIEQELELWASHPVLSQYLPEGEVASPDR